MNHQISKSNRRNWIILNLLSMTFIVIFFYTGKYFEQPYLFFAGGAISLVLLIISFKMGFVKTKLWRLVHTKKEDLDERQILVVLNALRYSYVVFVMFCLVIIYGFALVNKGPINVLVAACLLYSAHVLPAVIIGWTEKRSVTVKTVNNIILIAYFNLP